LVFPLGLAVSSYNPAILSTCSVFSRYNAKERKRREKEKTPLSLPQQCISWDSS
jgi:hypothetical protein